MAIVAPNTMDFIKMYFTVIITGMPNYGKTTLGLSAPNPLLADFDNGIARVKAEHRKDTIIAGTYEEFLADVKEAEGKYETIVVDTCGALIEALKDWAMRTDPKASKNNGGFSLQGYGIIKQEFLRLSNYLQKHFNTIYIFHETMERNGDEGMFYQIVVEGATRSLVFQSASLACHLFVQNGKRYAGFTPTEQYNAKSAFGIKGVIEIPELKDGDKNDFLTRLFEKARANLAAEVKSLDADKAKYDAAMKRGMSCINSLDGDHPEYIEACVEEIKQIDHALTSKKELQAALKKRLDELFVFDKTEKVYKVKE